MEKYKLEYPILVKFLLGGKADFILHNLTSENHINFLIGKSDTNKYWQVYYILDKKRPQYIGAIITYKDFVEKDCYQYKPRHPLIGEDEVKMNHIFSKFFEFVFKQDKIPNNCEVLYTGKCSVCHRKLTDPISIERGIGKYCLEHYT